MYAKKRHVQSVYGRGRSIKHAELLWDEAISASPIKPYRSSAIEVVVEKRPVLTSLDVNSSPAGLKETKQSTPKIMDEVKDSNLEVAESQLFDSPVRVSTPIQTPARQMEVEVQRTHIKFDSSETSLIENMSPIARPMSRDRSSSASSTLSSTKSLEILGDLPGAFDRLTTNRDASDEQDQSIAAIEDLQDIQTLLSLCNQLSAQNFTEYIQGIAGDSEIVKIGEASFSEVFLGTCRETGVETVYKIIPFGEGANEVPINDVIQELRISRAMSQVSGFVQLRGMRIVDGTYPESLLEIWDSWAETHETESDRPDWYETSQQYCIVALENGGTDLEHYKIKNWTTAQRLLYEIVETLARGETEKEFEHRDLHWGNILVRDSADKGPKITIIDYTLSRALVQDQLSDIAFYGFADRAIFEAEGDDYQFEMYRLMRDLVTDGEDDVAAEDWTKFYPSTNALWIHYLVDKLLYAKDLQKPALRVSKRNPTLDEDEIYAWKRLDTLWKTLNPGRKYKVDERAIDSANRILELMQ